MAEHLFLVPGLMCTRQLPVDHDKGVVEPVDCAWQRYDTGIAGHHYTNGN